MISPTNGRVVWYKPLAGDSSLARLSDQPMAAQVCHVWSDTCVNLAVTDHRGTIHNKSSITLAQDRDPCEGECYWMPYQKGQAAKTEALEGKQS